MWGFGANGLKAYPTCPAGDPGGPEIRSVDCCETMREAVAPPNAVVVSAARGAASPLTDNALSVVPAAGAGRLSGSAAKVALKPRAQGPPLYRLHVRLLSADNPASITSMIRSTS